MTFWDFANNHPWLAFVGTAVVVLAVVFLVLICSIEINWWKK